MTSTLGLEMLGGDPAASSSQALAVTPAGHATTAGSLGLRRPTAASSAGHGATTGSLAGQRPLTAASAAHSTTAGSLVITGTLMVAPAGRAATTALLGVIAGTFTAASASHSTTAATVRITRALRTSATGSATAQATGARSRRFIATSSGVGVSAADLTVQAPSVLVLHATAAGIGTCHARMNVRPRRIVISLGLMARERSSTFSIH